MLSQGSALWGVEQGRGTSDQRKNYIQNNSQTPGLCLSGARNASENLGVCEFVCWGQGVTPHHGAEEVSSVAQEVH